MKDSKQGVEEQPLSVPAPANEEQAKPPQTNQQTGTSAPPQLIGDSNVFNQDDEDDTLEGASGSSPQGGIMEQTSRLLNTGILTPVTTNAQVNQPVVIQFRTLYPNGCWSQTDAEHLIEDFNIQHEYNTTYTEGQLCTMAMLPGGFKTSLMLDKPGTYTGIISVNNEERTRYTLQVNP